MPLPRPAARPTLTDPAPDVLMLLPEFGSGGVARVGCTLANGFKAQGLDVAVATIGDGQGPTRPLLDQGVRVLGMPLLGARPRALAARIFAAPALVRTLRAAPPGVLLSPGNHAHLLATLTHWAAARPETALVLKLTNPIDKAHHGAARRTLRRIAYRWMIGRADSVLVLSPEAGDEVVRLDPAAAAKVRVVVNPYLPDRTPGPASEGEVLREPPREPLVLAVGRLTRQKNFELLLQAMAALKSRPWRLAILGSGEQRRGLGELARRLGLEDRVEFLGHVADPQPYYRRAAVLAVTSRWEGLPAVAIEALAAGCPVVTTDCSPALSRIVSASRMGAVTPAAAPAVAEAIARTLDGPRDRRSPTAALAFTVASGVLSHLSALQALWPRPAGGVRPAAAAVGGGLC